MNTTRLIRKLEELAEQENLIWNLAQVDDEDSAHHALARDIYQNIANIIRQCDV